MYSVMRLRMSLLMCVGTRAPHGHLTLCAAASYQYCGRSHPGDTGKTDPANRLARI